MAIDCPVLHWMQVIRLGTGAHILDSTGLEALDDVCTSLFRVVQLGNNSWVLTSDLIPAVE